MTWHTWCVLPLPNAITMVSGQQVSFDSQKCFVRKILLIIIYETGFQFWKSTENQPGISNKIFLLYPSNKKRF